MSEQLLRRYIRARVARNNLLRECIKEYLMKEIHPSTDDLESIDLSSLEAYGAPMSTSSPGDPRGIAHAMVPPAEPLLDVVKGALSSFCQANKTCKFEVSPDSPNVLYARFNSSSSRDMMMEDLATDIEDAIKAAYPMVQDWSDKFTDPYAISWKKISKHSRQILQLRVGKEKITVAFKGPSFGGEGLDFETALFAVLTVGLPIKPEEISLNPSERKRLINKFGFGKDLKDVDMIKELKLLLANKTALAKSGMSALIDRARVSEKEMDKTWGDVTSVTLSGGEGGKADIVIGTKKSGEVDLSLKHEKEKSGTNVFIYNKDLGDGIKEMMMGRTDAKMGLKQFPAKLITNPATEAWWQTARKEILKALKENPDYLAVDEDGKEHLKGLSIKDEKEFVKKPGASAVLKISQLFNADKEAGGRAGKVPANTLRAAAKIFEDSLRTLTPLDVLSLIEESQLGKESKNDLFKLTSHGKGTNLKKVNYSDATQAINDEKVTVDDLEVKVTKRMGSPTKANPQGKPTQDTVLKLINKKTKTEMASLIIRGLKFRNGVFGTTNAQVAIKTRA
jgi:hypothetical protein